MKKILVDGRMVGAQGHGIGNYVEDIARYFLAHPPKGFALEFLIAPQCPSISPLRQFSTQEFKVKFLSPLEPWLLARQLRSYTFSLFHSPSFVSLADRSIPHIHTVHDLNHLQWGNFFQKLYYRFLLRPSLLSSAMISTVSEFSRRELESWLGEERKIRVIPNAISTFPTASNEILTKFGLPKVFFFCLSNSKPHKNVDILLEAYSLAREQGCEIPLLTNVEGEYIEGVRRFSNLKQMEIATLMHHCHSFFMPSLYEGFSRTPLEATLSGKAVIVSDIAAHRETLAGVEEATFISPRQERIWASTFLAFSKGKVPLPPSESSIQWVKENYSLETFGKALLEFYESALESPLAR